MNLFSDTFERHKQLMYESLSNNWEDQVDWNDVINTVGDSPISSRLDSIFESIEEAELKNKMNIDSRPTEDFWKMFDELPEQAKISARRNFELFKDNPLNPILRFHLLQATKNIYSINVGGSFRAIGFQETPIQTIGAPIKNMFIRWIWIGHHSKYDKVTKNINRIKNKL